MEEKKKPRIKILVACHKADPNIRQDDIYMPIQVGKALHPELNLGFQCDNTGDNISEKNGSYCELTALYWAWKNLKDVDYIGLAHYRRYLNISYNDILKDLTNNDIILTKPSGSVFSNLLHLTDGTTREDVYLLLLYIQKYYYSYIPEAISYLYNSNKWIGGNIFITSKQIFDNYCHWLFELLFGIEKIIPTYNHFRLKRIIGYFGEVLLPIFCRTQNLKISNRRLINEKRSPLKFYLSQLRNDFIFKLSHPHPIGELIIPESTLTSIKIDNIQI